MNSSSRSRGAAAETVEAVSEPGAGDPVQQVQDMFAVIEGIEDGGEGPQVQEIGADPHQVGGDAVQFAQNHPDEFSPLRHREAEEFFHRHAVALIVGQGVEVIDPAHVGQELLVVAILGHVFVAPVAVANDRFGLGDVLPVHRQEHPQDPVGAGMLRTQVEGIVLFFYS